MKKEDKYTHLSSEEFSLLSDIEKADYYNTLSEEKVEARSSADRFAIAEAYSALGNYKNAASLSATLKEEAERQRAYELKEADSARKRLLMLGGICVGGVGIIVSIALIISLVSSDKKSYAKAVALYEAEEYTAALEIFNTIPDYEDVGLYIKAINGELSGGKIMGQRARKGDIIKLGACYTDGNVSEPKEVIEWVVLEVDDKEKRALVISRDILTVIAYGEEDVWKYSSICNWLNDEFLNEAFSDAEIAILDTNMYVETDETGEVTSALSSKLALMGVDEMKTYLADSVYRTASGAGVNEWWLRTAVGEGKIAYVSANGSIVTEGKPSDSSDMGLRPVAWINFD